MAGMREHGRRLLFERQDRAAIEPLKSLAGRSKLPQARMQALVALAGMHALTADDLLARLGDEHPRVREHAVRLVRALRQRRATTSREIKLAGFRSRYPRALSTGVHAG